MALNLTIARPYAKAIFEIAKADNDFSGWEANLELLQVMLADELVQHVIGNQTIDCSEKSLWLLELLGAKCNTKFKQFVQTLAMSARLDVVPGIKVLFTQYKDEELNILKITLESAVALDNAAQQSYVKTLSKVFSKQIEAEFVVNPALLGGVVVRAGSKVLDYSLQGKLRKLQASLIL
jgi:F-type H+-transporting ATPase subunit delta